jgi:hypothetical protein
MATKPKPTTTPSFEDRRVMSIPTFRERNLMSKTAYIRRRQAQLEYFRLRKNRQVERDVSIEKLLPPIVEIAKNRHGVRVYDEAAWQEAQIAKTEAA